MSSDRFQRLYSLFEAASELPSEAREGYLERACGDDEELRREVATLLAINRGNPTMLRSDAFLSPDRRVESGGGSAPNMVGPYNLVREIGRGGMGIVYLADDTRLNRRVALKALGPDLRVSKTHQARFRREAEVAASLTHPGIATIYAFEEWEGSPYIVAEFVEGRTLDEEFKSGATGFEVALEIGIQLSSAIAVAHEHGVIHRDLKPQNVVRASDGRLKILDFGLAAVFGRPDRGGAPLTESGTMLGTPAYMSPEQLRGQRADARSDLFAVGIILAEAANGRHPFEGETTAIIMSEILMGEPAGFDRLDSEQPRFAAALRRCLRRDPERRFQSALELQSELKAIQGRSAEKGRISSTTKISNEHVQAGWWIFHQFAVIAFCALACLALWQVSVVAPGVVTRFGFIAGLGAASAIAIARMHLLFTLRNNQLAMRRELRRVMPWANRADWIFSALLAAAGLAVIGERRLISALLLAAAVAYVAVFSLVEPSTRATVFDDDQ